MPISLQDALIICANLLPVGTYFCVLGLLHALRRPLVTTGVRDFVALAIALSGLTINGPINYVLHSRILPEFLGNSRWFALILYVVLAAALLPRGYETLVVYNSSEVVVAVAVRAVLDRLAVPFQEVPGGWIMAQRGTSLELDSFPALNNVTLHFRGLRDRELYQRLHEGLAKELAVTRGGLSLVGVLIAAVGGLVLAMPIWIISRNPQDIAALVREVLRSW